FAGVNVSASNIDLFAALGSIEIGLQGGVIGDIANPSAPVNTKTVTVGDIVNPLSLSASVTLRDPNNDGIITLDELVSHNPDGSFAALQAPSVQGSGVVILPIAVGGLEDLLGVTINTQPSIVAAFDARLLPTPTFDVDFDVNGLDEIFNSFKDFSLDTLLK